MNTEHKYFKNKNSGTKIEIVLYFPEYNEVEYRYLRGKNIYKMSYKALKGEYKPLNKIEEALFV
jgi:hypothetical protein